MVDRFLVWVGAGVITVGLSAGMIAGAGLAIATEGASSGDGGTKGSEPSNTTESKEDSDGNASEPGDSPPNDPDTTDADDATNDESEGDDATTDTSEEDALDESTDKDDSNTAGTDRSVARVKVSDTRDDADHDAADKTAAAKLEKDVAETTSDSQVSFAQRKSVVVESAVTETEGPETTAVAFAAPAEAAIDATAAASPMSGVLNLIGTIVFNLYGLVQRVAGGPPILPANSTVSVRSSTLVLECGCNSGDTIEVPADWYVPKVEEGEDPPDRLIYLQHGFLAAGPWYSHTAAALAEQTNSIVVAPTITSNFLASDACWLGASPMHEAMAKLFDDGNTALADSALAAGYSGPIPNRVVLMGHSLGGGAVAGIAGAMADNETEDRLAGVVLLDGVGLDGTMADSLANVDPDIPIYNLAAPRYFWNQFGVGTDALHEARPDGFIGVTLAGGSHVDSMRGGNPLIQFSQELVAGFTSPENAAAAQILMVDWVNDMFAGVQQDPITDEFTIDTPAGPATAVPLPNDLTKEFILNPLQQFVSLGDGFFTFEPACVEESIGKCAQSVAA